MDDTKVAQALLSYLNDDFMTDMAKNSNDKRFNRVTWSIFTIRPENIAEAQWYRLHDETTMIRLRAFGNKNPAHILLKIHDTGLDMYLMNPGAVFQLHYTTSLLMTLYYWLEFGLNGTDVFNASRYPGNTVLRLQWDCCGFDTEVKKNMKNYIEFNLRSLF